MTLPLNHDLLAELALERIIGDGSAPLALQRIRSPKSLPALNWFEALLRPDQIGLDVGPEAVFKMAHKIGCERPLDRIVLLTAVNILAVDPSIDRLGVNLCPATATDRQLPEFISAALSVQGIPAHRLVIEFPETYPGSVDEMIAAMRRWRSFGFRIALDDVGKGASIVRAVLAGVVDVVKFDATVIADAARCPAPVVAHRLARTVEYYTTLGISVVFEGIETAAHEKCLSILPTASGQGFLIHRPEPRLDPHPLWPGEVPIQRSSSRNDDAGDAVPPLGYDVAVAAA